MTETVLIKIQQAQAQAHQYFSCLLELQRDSGLIGQVLKKYPEWFISEVDRWAEWNGEYQRKKENPNHLPLPDPWQVLLDSPAVSPMDETIFRAAQSQLKALRRLSRIARGEATLNTDWNEKMENAKTPTALQRAFNKVAAARAKYDLFHAEAQNAPNPLYREWVSQQIEKSYRERIKRGHGSEAKRARPFPRLSQVRDAFKLPSRLIEWWVRGPNATPGLMFFRNEARTEFLKLWLPQTNLSPHTVKKVCQQLQLVPVGKKKHFVWNYSIKLDGENCWKSEGHQRNGKSAFHGIVTSN